MKETHVSTDGTGDAVVRCKVIMPGLKKGMKSDDVLQLQKKLQDKGLLPEGSATGFFGSATEAALKNLQTSQGLPSTGYFGNMTLESLSKD